MGWDRIIGQRRVKELLRRILSRGTIAHAYLFHGAEGVGKDAAAIEFARVLNCERRGDEGCGACASCKKIDALQHPNLILVFPLPVGRDEKKGHDPIEVLLPDQVKEIQEQIRLKSENPYHAFAVSRANFIKVNSIRRLRRDAALSTFEGGKKVFIISQAEAMNPEAANTLLKTLEEPLTDSVIILTTARKEQLLPTIISRCQLVRFDPLGEEEIRDALVERTGAAVEQAALVARLAHGSYAAAHAMLSVDMVAERGSVVRFLRLALGSQKVPLVAEIEQLCGGNGRPAVERWLKLLQVWLHDAMILRDHGGIGVLNVDQMNDLMSFIRNFPRADLPAALDRVDRSVALLDKNVYLPLILTALAVDLKRHLSASA